MKYIFSLILIVCSIATSATDYYVSSAGNDAANGLSESTAWKTIGKVNSAFSAFQPGDRILFRRGDTFYGTLKVTRSGLAGNPITIGAYGSGNRPVISGFTTISSWTNEGGGIFSRAITSESSPVMVSFDGVNTAMGRFPNSGWMTIDSHNTNQSLTDADLNSGITNWTGAEVVIRVKPYIVNHLPITGHTNQTLTFSTGTIYDLINGYGYFIQNDKRTLDTYKEWYSDGSRFYMYFGSQIPGNHIVKVSTVDNGVNIVNCRYITIDISFL